LSNAPTKEAPEKCARCCGIQYTVKIKGRYNVRAVGLFIEARVKALEFIFGMSNFLDVLLVIRRDHCRATAGS